jgi:hypothetical protein
MSPTIFYNGSIRFGSQATCEQAIGDIGHGIRSKKSPFKNIASYETDEQSARILHVFYPTLSVSKAKLQMLKHNKYVCIVSIAVMI